MWSALDEPGIVYQATSKASGNRYIGVTGKTLERRKSQHVYAALKMRKNHRFARAIRKHGVDGFLWETLSTHSTMREALKEEERLIRNGRPEYNATMGGQAGHHIMSAKDRLRISELHRGNTYRLGMTHTAETKSKLRAAGLRDRDKWLERSRLGPAASARRVVCMDDGTTHKSASAAARAYGVAKSLIIEVCNRNPRRCTAGGRVFRYEDDHCDHQQELRAANARRLKRSKTGVSGVFPYIVGGRDTGRIRVRFTRGGRRFDLGIFDDLDSAKRAYNAAINGDGANV